MKTREEWENTGMLGGLENVDAERLVRLFNFCDDILEFHIHGLMDDEIMLMYPVIRRIYSGVKQKCDRYGTPTDWIDRCIDIIEIMTTIATYREMKIHIMSIPHIDGDVEFVRILCTSLSMTFYDSLVSKLDAEVDDPKKIRPSVPFKTWRQYNK